MLIMRVVMVMVLMMVTWQWILLGVVEKYVNDDEDIRHGEGPYGQTVWKDAEGC